MLFASVCSPGDVGSILRCGNSLETATVTACALLCRSWVLSRSEDAGSWPLPALLPRLWFGSSRIKPFPVLDLEPAELWQCSARTSKSKTERLARTFWFSETFGKTQSLQTLGHFSFKKVKLWMLGWWKNPNPWSTFKVLFIRVRDTSFSSWRKRWQCSRNWVSVEAGIFRTVSRTQNVLEIKYTETNLDQKVLSDGSCKPNRVSFMMKRCGNTWTALSFFPAPSVTSFWKLRLHFVLLYSSELLTEKTSNVCWNLVLPVC